VATLTFRSAAVFLAEVFQVMSITRVAKHAGVSIATVSRVLNHSPSVKPETARQVWRSIQALQYQKSVTAKTPAAEKRMVKGTGKIAILTVGQPRADWLSIPVMAEVVSSITQAAQAHNVGVLLEEMPDPSRLGAAILNREVDGAIAFMPSSITPAALEPLRQHRMPVVRVMGDHLAPFHIDHVGPDNTAVGQLAHDYLVGLGCTRNAMITTNPEWEQIWNRAIGFANAARRAETDFCAFVATEDAVTRGLYGARAVTGNNLESLIDALLKESPRRSGLFVPRDAETVQVYQQLMARGVRIGSEVTIVSCDNEEIRLSMLSPRPASIELGTEEIGRRAVARLLARIEQPNEPCCRYLVGPRLITP
jgi:LacI family transcriptional regulator